MSDRIEGYLDRLFALLAGSGQGGRALFAETEARLAAAVEKRLAEGMDEAHAAEAAIALVGAPEAVVRARLGDASAGFAVRLGRLFAAAWMFFGVAMVAIGASGVLALSFVQLAGPEFVVPTGGGLTYTPERCAELMQLAPEAADCGTAAMRHQVDTLTTRPLQIGMIGLVLLAAFAITRRMSWRLKPLAWVTTLPGMAMVSSVGAVGFGMIAFGSLTNVAVRIAYGQLHGSGASLAAGLVALAVCAVFFPRAWTELGQRKT